MERPYSEETATTMRNLDSDLVLTPLNAEEEWGLYPPGQAPAEGPSTPRAAPGLPRRSLRRASASVARLKKIVGDSQVRSVQTFVFHPSPGFNI